MLLTAKQEFSRLYPGSDFSLLSISPRQDRSVPQLRGVSVVWAHWFALISLFLPISLVAAPFLRLIPVQWSLRRIPYFRALLDCDALIDLSGIAFVDGRGLALFAYNTACCAPALLLGRPVLKLAQSLGPFRQALNRAVARQVIRRCALVVARGETSGRNLTQLTGQPAITLPDTTFCLKMPTEVVNWASLEISRVGFTVAPVVISPSRVFELACLRRGIDFSAVCAKLIQDLQTQGLRVALLAHSKAAGIAKNDDPAVCTRILALLPADQQPPLLIADDPLRARALIGRAAIFVGSRYHALVSAYAQAVPCLALSWNDKYTDLARLFGCTEQVIPVDKIDANLLLQRVLEMHAQASSAAENLRLFLPGVRAGAEENFTRAKSALKNLR